MPSFAPADRTPPGALLPYRLAHIALRCPSLARSALLLAFSIAKDGKNVSFYQCLVEIAADTGYRDVAQIDPEWATRRDEENRRESSRLENELRGYKNNLIRESIRMGQEDLATHLLLTGGPTPESSSGHSAASHQTGLTTAYQAFQRMRDYCTTPAHVSSMTLRLGFTSLLQAVVALDAGASASSHWNTLLSNANRLRTSGVKEEEQVKLTPIAQVMSGIAHMGLGDYRAAAGYFLRTPFEYHHLGLVDKSNYERLIANANDVAIYGGLCCLATMTREELIDNVLGGPFRAFLELEPHMRKAIGLYTTAKYQACIDTLQRYHSDWSLDLFLGAPAPATSSSIVDRLFANIRERSITAYFSSFSEVSLASLTSTFPPASDAPDAMEMEVLGMIGNGTLDARLDVVRGVLVAPRTELRRATHQDARRAAEEVERTLLLRLHRVNVTLAGLEVPKVKSHWEGGRVGNGFGKSWE